MPRSDVRERPILFSGPMVKAILAGTKVQTRRVAALRLDGETTGDGVTTSGYEPDRAKGWGRARPGDRLWVRETWADVNSEEGPAIAYRADRCIITWHSWCVEKGPDYGAGPSMNYEKYPGQYTMWWSDLLNGEPDHAWRPSIFMPRWASRITLEIESVRVERLQQIPLDDVFAELGETKEQAARARSESWEPYDAFAALWDAINGKRASCAWADNPWVWVVAFRRITP